MNLSKEQAIYFRDQLREARAVALQDAEGYQEILFALERLGSFLKRRIQALGKYEDKIQDVARQSVLAEQLPETHRSWHLSFRELYRLVRDGRNDALHQGAFARHLTDSAIQLALVLEDALMNNHAEAGSYMVRAPVCSSLWQPLSFIRQQMLANSFTYLPILIEASPPPAWLLVSDYHVARYLRRGDRQERLAKTLAEAIDDRQGELTLEPAETCHVDTPVNEVLEKSKGKPVLIIEKGQPERLLGIITPFDIL